MVNSLAKANLVTLSIAPSMPWLPKLVTYIPTKHPWTLTQQLCYRATTMGVTFGITTAKVSVQSLHSSGTMSLLYTKLNLDMIFLLSHWYSGKILCYLHVQAFPHKYCTKPLLL